MKGTIISRGILALGVSVALLAVTASVAGATKTLSPTSADFGDVQVGTTSPATGVHPECQVHPVV